MDLPELPSDVKQSLAAFMSAARQSLGDDLVSAVLFGSAAEGRLRATSDVNLMLVLKRFDPDRMDGLREPFRLAHAAVRLEVMFILENELPTAAEAFAVKFLDIVGRHRVLAGHSVLEKLKPTPEAIRSRLRQILLNFVLRTRERYALASLREEQLALLVADCAAPLRSAAEALLELEGRPAPSPREALAILAAEFADDRFTYALANLSKAREERRLPARAGAPSVLALIDLANALLLRARSMEQ